PGDVQRDRGGDTGEAVHLGRVGDLLVGIAWHPRLGEHLEAGTGVAVRPGGRLDALRSQRVLYLFGVLHRNSSVETFAFRVRGRRGTVPRGDVRAAGEVSHATAAGPAGSA